MSIIGDLYEEDIYNLNLKIKELEAEVLKRQMTLDTIAAWVRFGVLEASSRWDHAQKQYGRNSIEEKRASVYLHDLINFCQNIRAWAGHPEWTANDQWCKELREDFGPDYKESSAKVTEVDRQSAPGSIERLPRC